MEESAGVDRLLKASNARRELNDVLTEISKCLEFTPDNATLLGFLYLVWDFRSQLFGNLSMKGFKPSGEEPTSQQDPFFEAEKESYAIFSEPEFKKNAQKRSQELLEALQEAEKGNYMGIKQHIQKQANIFLNHSQEKQRRSLMGEYEIYDPGAYELKKVGEKLKKMATLIPETGDPLHPPPTM